MKTPAIIERIGPPGVVGLGLLLFGASFFLGNVLPLHDERDELIAEQSSLRNALKKERAADGGAPEVRQPPPLAEAPDLLRRFDELATKHGIAAGNTSYQYQVVIGGQLLEVTVPLKATYPALRAWLRDALTLPAPATLNEFALQRQAASDPAVDAQVRISYAFRGPS